jgi:PBSX family phage terminase large subunit
MAGLKRVGIWGANAQAYNSRESEVLLSGSAGSGKTLTWLFKILTLCDYHPGARILIVRKTRESLTESALVTWERDVLGADHEVLTRNPVLRRVRQSYRFPNRSEVVVGGIDKPGKILSSEYDFVYVPEATDLDLEDWETLGSRLRAGVVPFQQIAADCNPTSPHSWLYQRQASGVLRMYTSTHQQNPRYYNRSTGEWTVAGKQYLERLERMTGARRDRFLHGLWVAAEGVVYAYDAAHHLHPADWQPEKSWRRVWGIDWGKTSPTVLVFGAVDEVGRLHCYRELYQTRLRPDQLGKWAKEQISLGNESRPVAIVCDHDPERKQLFEQASGLMLTLADKADRDKGIEAMQSRFDFSDGELPRIFFRADSRETLRGKEPDRFLVDASKPTSAVEEVVGYVWDADFVEDTPIPDNDHAMDAIRYVCRYVDSRLMPVPYSPPHKYTPLLPPSFQGRK